MSNFKERLIDERDQLEEKLAKLEAFMDSDKFDSIETMQMSLLHVQMAAMNTYYTVLEERIAWINAEEGAENFLQKLGI